MARTTSKFLSISGVCAIVAPLLLLAIDLFRLATGRDFEWSIGMWIAFVLFVPAVLGFAYYLVAEGSRLGYLAGGLAFFGAMAGASMQVLFRTHAVLAEQGAADVVERLRGTFKLVAATQMIGLSWPVGLLLFAVALFMLDRSKWIISLALVASSVLFPIGRIAGSNAAVVTSGLCLIVAFGLIGKLLLSREANLG